MKLSTGNLFSQLPLPGTDEEFAEILAGPGLKIERIVSHSQASPEVLWYDQDWDEWVVVLTGSAELLVEGEDMPRHLGPGDHIHLPAHLRHRVARTATEQPTIWLAVHYRPDGAAMARASKPF